MGSSQSNEFASGIVWNDSDKEITYALTQQIIKHKRSLYQQQYKGGLKNTEVNFFGDGKLNQQYYYQDLNTYVIVKPGQVTNTGLENIKLPAYFSCWIGNQKQVQSLFFENVIVQSYHAVCIKITQEKISSNERLLNQQCKKCPKTGQIFQCPLD